MKIDLIELIEGQVDELDIDVEEQIEPDVYHDDALSLITPVSFSGSIRAENDDIYIFGKIEWTAEFSCNRCLEKFTKSVSAEINERLVKEGDMDFEEGDCFVVRNNKVAISEIIKSVFVLSLPMKILCNTNCKGLCPVCGINLNIKQCSCKNESIDPRLAKLKDLL